MRIAPVFAILLLPLLAPAASLTGSLTDPAGASIVHAAVELDPGSQKYQVQTDDAGVYKFPDLPAGEYSLTVRVVGFYRLTVRPINLSASEQKRIPALMLDVAPSGCFNPFPPAFQLLAGDTTFGGLAGSVVRYGDSSELLEGVDVTLVCRTFTACASTKTDAKGLFSFGMLSPGEYGLSFRSQGFYPDQASAYTVRVKAGLESDYAPVFLERCPGGNCDPKLRPPRAAMQVVVCE